MKRIRVYGNMMQLAAFLIALPLLAADNSVEIVKRFIAADNKNWERASQYTYVSQADHFSYGKNGAPKKESSETHEIIFVEGGEYKKLIARNDRPLDAKEKAREEKNLLRIAAERRKQTPNGLFHKTVRIGTNEDLLTLFDTRVAGEEEIRGHKAWVVAATPKPGHIPADSREKEALSFERNLWIEQDGDHLLRML
jgi:hypothetical protein